MHNLLQSTKSTIVSLGYDILIANEHTGFILRDFQAVSASVYAVLMIAKNNLYVVLENNFIYILIK